MTTLEKKIADAQKYLRATFGDDVEAVIAVRQDSENIIWLNFKTEDDANEMIADLCDEVDKMF
jgi:hypothetical protein